MKKIFGKIAHRFMYGKITEGLSLAIWGCSVTFLIAMGVTWAQPATAAATPVYSVQSANITSGIISPEIATGYVKVSKCGSLSNGEMGVSEYSCSENRLSTPAQYIKKLHPNAVYVGFQPAIGGVYIYYKLKDPECSQELKTCATIKSSSLPNK